MGKVYTKKYNRELREYEVNRFLELKKRYEQLFSEKYTNQIINEKTKEALQDVACSKNRYEGLVKYYLDKLREKAKFTIEKEQETRIDTELENETKEGFENFVKDFKRFMTEASEECIDECEHIEIYEVGEENIDMIKAEKIYKEAFELMKSRNVKYGDSWKVLSIQSLANLCEMKLHRIANLDKLEPKIYDEMIDTLNYMVFGLLKLKEKDLGMKYNK